MRQAAIPVQTIQITPGDSEEHNIITFRVGTTAGDVAYVDGKGNTGVIPNVQIGERIDGVFRRIKSTGTTAEGITGWRA